MWRFVNNCELHVGEISRYKYDEQDLNFELDIDDENICYIYSTSSPLVDVWKKYSSDESEEWDIKNEISYTTPESIDPTIQSELLRFTTITNQEYTAVYNNKLPCVDVLKGGEFLFRIMHNEYHNDNMCRVVEFIENKHHGLLLLINDYHNCLSFYDMEKNMVKRYQGIDDFYTEYYRVQENNRDLLVIYGFYWSPVTFMKIMDIEKMLDTDGYKGGEYFPKDEDFKNLDCGKYTVPRVCAFKGQLFAPQEFMEVFKEDKISQENKKCTKVREH